MRDIDIAKFKYTLKNNCIILNKNTNIVKNVFKKLKLILKCIKKNVKWFQIKITFFTFGVTLSKVKLLF